MIEKVLFVDDDINILMGFKRQLRKNFIVETAEGGERGLALIKEQEDPFMVVVADMRMPNMDGIQFLKKVQDISPKSIRMMLTGNADVQTAINAVNEGNIFRFMTKPIEIEFLAQIVSSGIRQFQLVNAEKELLEKTFNGSIKLLTDLMSLLNPSIFNKASRIQRYVRSIVAQMGIEDGWQFEVSALLSQIGCLTLPPEILNKINSNMELNTSELELFDSHPLIGRKLLSTIPRLQPVAFMIGSQNKPMKSYEKVVHNNIVTGSQLLKVVIDYDTRIMSGGLKHEILKSFSEKPDEYNQELVKILINLPVEKVEIMSKTVYVEELTTHMITNEDIKTRKGITVISKGQEISYATIEYLRNFSKSESGIREPFKVLVRS